MPYNPINSISGNGIQGQVTATFTTGDSFWNITSQNLPGQALTGSFPNSVNPYAISTQTVNITWPMRGGKNLPNPGFRSVIPAGSVGISSIGVLLYNAKSTITVPGQNSTTWTVNAGKTGIFGEDIYGGRPTSTGLYNYINGNFIQNNAWGSISSSTWQGFVFSRDKCYRDLGLIIDSLATDLLFNSTSQTTFCGAQYWSHTGYTGEIGRELTTTTNAINYVRDLSKKIILNDTTGPRYQNTFTQVLSGPIAASGQQVTLDEEFKYITDILNKGTVGVTNKIITNGTNPSTNVNIQSAYNKLQANKEYIQREAIAFVEATKGFRYSEDITFANAGTMIDTIVLDLLFNSTTESTFSGLEHWNKKRFVGPIPGQVTTTTNSLLYLQELVQNIVTNVTTGTRYQSTVTQNVSLPSATLAEKLRVHDSVDHILNVITVDGYELNNNIVPNNTVASTSTYINRALNLLTANKNYIQAEVLAYVEATKTSNVVYNKANFYTEVGNIVDAISFDLIYDGNLQSIIRGSSYFEYDPVSSPIPNQQSQTVAAYTYIRSIIPFIVTATPITPLQQFSPQVINLTPATAVEASVAQSKINVVTNIITNGPSGVSALNPLSLSKTVSTNIINAGNIILANKDFIQHEVIQFINNRYAFTYDQGTCYRDVGYIIDSVSFDLLYGGNLQAIKSGVYYWGYSISDSVISRELPQTVDAFNYLKSVITNVITRTSPITRYQQEYQQIANIPGGTSTEALAVENNIDYLISIINDGVEDIEFGPINLTRSTNSNIINAANIIYANRDFIRKEVIGYLDIQVANKTGIYATGDTGVYNYYSDGHSKIIGWARDGYPIYGPYGYLIPTDIFSTVVKLTSGYKQINSPNRPINRTVVVNGNIFKSGTFSVYNSAGLAPGMSLENSQLGINPVTIISVVGTRVTVNREIDLLSGSTLVASYPIGALIEDYIYQPTNNDLDQFNGRYCVTPEYPTGTYAYFITEDEDGNPAYPYIIGPSYYGSTVADSTDSFLSNIIPEIGTLSPYFSSTITNYTITVDNDVEVIRFRGFVNDLNSTLQFNEVNLVSGEFTPNVSLAVGLTTSTFVVTSQYLSTTEYKIVTTRLKKSRKGITQLRVKDGTLNPIFNQSTSTYSITYGKTFDKIEITVVSEFPENILRINNNLVLSNTPTQVNLDFGANLINIQVFAEDNSFINYYISATRLNDVSGLTDITTNRGAISPSFNKDRYNYYLTVANTVTNVRISSTPVDLLSNIFVNGVQTNPNTLSLPVSLQTGNNPIGVKVVSSDGSNFVNYRLNVTRTYSDVTTLAFIYTSEGFLDQVFDENTLTYTQTVSNQTTVIQILIFTTEVNQLITVNGIRVTPYDLYEYTSHDIVLNVGVNTIDIVSTAENRIDTRTYTILVTRVASSDSSLSNLNVANAIINPTFASNILNYSATVPYSITNTFIKPTATENNATILVNNQSVLSGNNSQTIPLVIGNNNITVSVTAPSGLSNRTYGIFILRKDNTDARLVSLTTNVGSIQPDFSSTITNYSVFLENAVSQLQVNAIASDSRVKSIRASTINYSTSSRFSGSFSIPLLGSIVNDPDPRWNGETEITLDVLAADNQTHKIYKLNAFRSPPINSALSDLTIDIGTLSPDFSPGITDYFIGVPYSVNQIRVKGTKYYSLQEIVLYASTNPTKIESDQYSNYINLFVGNNTIPITVYAADKNYYTGYNVFVNRASLGLDNNAYLSNLETSTGTWLTSFDPMSTSYRVDVPYEEKTIRVKATAQKTFSTIRINDKIVQTGFYSEPINLNIKTNNIHVEVTAQDNTTKFNYSILVFRNSSTVSTLKNLLLSYGSLNRPFDPNITQYTVNLKNAFDRISVKPIVSDNQEFLEINSFPTAPDTWTNPVDLAVGTNTVTIKVIAGDLEHFSIYQLIINREEPSAANPIDLFLSDGKNLSASLYKSEILKVYTKVNLDKILTGGVTPPLQDIELLIPYKGGKNEKTDVPVLLPKDTIIGITVVGVPIRSPRGGTFSGLNNTVWTFNNSIITGQGSDEFGGGGATFDSSTGYYYLDGRFNFFNPWNEYQEWSNGTTHDDGHSKLVGYAIDGYPIYGSFGYSDPLNRYSQVIRMKSGYESVNDPNRPPPITVTYNGNQLFTDIQLTSLEGLGIGMTVTGGPIPDYYNMRILNINQETGYITLNAFFDFGPFAANINCAWPVGGFIEDYRYNSNKQGRTLDIHNGRYCVTPEYPYGTYAYFITGDVYQEYPYIIGNTFYGEILDLGKATKDLPKWVTPPGFIVTATEGLYISKSIVATGINSYKLISGNLPSGLNLSTSTGVISGTPRVVYQLETSKFVVRARNDWGIADREFAIDVKGATPPIITTPGPRLSIGPSGENYLVNGQIVDMQFSAMADVMPSGKSLFFFIKDGDGQLPPGLILTSTGRLYGQVQDILALFYRASANGNYDMEVYDQSPYEHLSQTAFGVQNKFVNKIYKFFLSVSTGAAVARQEYQIFVDDPATYIKTGPYPVPVQWVTPANLGSYRANTNVVITLETHDCDPGGGIITYDWFTANNGVTSVIPAGLSLDTNNGIISGFLRYTPVYTTTYTFKMRVYKNSVVTGTTSFRDKTFNMTILGSVISSLTFETKNDIGKLYQGEQSELYVKAIHSDPTVGITYSLLSGSLPPGLTLSIDGAIQGTVQYNMSATTVSVYNFSIKARDSSLTNETTGNFSISVYPYDGNSYTSLYLRPLLKIEQRDLYDQFINDQSIFDPNLLYRKYDSNFGIQTSVKFVLEYAIAQKNIDDYVSGMQEYFRVKKLEFGDVKSAVAIDDYGNVIYEVIYVDLIDRYVSLDGKSIGATVEFDSQTYYPNSINNMQAALETISSTNEILLPKFMKTIQSSTGLPLGKILCMPICYCLPGRSKEVLARIEASGFDFKSINFEVDRLIVVNTLEDNTTKYVLFPGRKI